MPLALVQDEIFVTLHFEDIAEDITRRTVQMKWDTDLATTLANGLAHAALWQATTDAAVNKMTVTLNYEDAAVSPGAGAENQKVAHVILKLTKNPPMGLTTKAKLEVPAPKSALQVGLTGPTANDVDVTEANLVALEADFRAAGNAYISHGQNSEAIVGGYIHHFQSKKG